AQDVLLRAFAEAAGDRPDVRLVLIGDVPECAAQREMQRYADDLRQFPVDAGLADRVRFAGWREDVPAVLAAADGYVHAARWEGWPLTVMEAMAAGVPVVFTDCAGRPPGFAEGQDGWIVPTEDVHALADRIGRMVQMSPAQRRQMGQAGRAFCRSHYDIRAVGQRFVAIVEHVLAGETDVGKQFAEGRATWPCS
ncbi:MAG: glycosyltransferase family 4 protein, partial [Planctomycetota bacterium]